MKDVSIFQNGNENIVRISALKFYTDHMLMHRGLKLDGAICQGEICNSLKSEKFSKSFLSYIGKNKIKF